MTNEKFHIDYCYRTTDGNLKGETCRTTMSKKDVVQMLAILDPLNLREHLVNLLNLRRRNDYMLITSKDNILEKYVRIQK